MICGKRIFLVSILTAALLLSCNKGSTFQYEKKVDSVTVIVSSDGKRLAKGKNQLTIKMVDASGQALTDSIVHVRFSFSWGRGRTPLDDFQIAERDDDSYTVTADLSEPGEWNVHIHAMNPDSKALPINVEFKIEVESK